MSYVWFEYKDFADHEMLGYIDGLAFCMNKVDQSLDCAYNSDSVYAHGFDLAVETMWDQEELAAVLYRDLCDDLYQKWKEHCDARSKANRHPRRVSVQS